MSVHGNVCNYRVTASVRIDDIETVEKGLLVSMSLQFDRQLCIVQPMVFIQPLFDGYLVYFTIVFVGRSGYMLSCKIQLAAYPGLIEIWHLGQMFDIRYGFAKFSFSRFSCWQIREQIP